MLKWLDARAATQFGQELAQDLLSTLAASMSGSDSGAKGWSQAVGWR